MESNQHPKVFEISEFKKLIAQIEDNSNNDNKMKALKKLHCYQFLTQERCNNVINKFKEPGLFEFYHINEKACKMKDKFILSLSSN